MGTKNIIIFGESGCGKSSVVNMIAGWQAAKVSSSPVGCTFKHERHEASFDGVSFNIYDTSGLNEGEQGRVPHWEAINQLYTLIRNLDSVSLLIYCMRGRIKENARANWILFGEVLCAKKVPIIAVETGLENEEDLEARRIELGKALEKYGIVPRGIACVVAVRGITGQHEKRYESSQRRLRRLIKQSYRKTPWSVTTDNWIGHIYKTTYTTKLCLFSEVRVEFAKEAMDMVDEFAAKTKMKKDDSEWLKTILLNAETRFYRRKHFKF